MSLDRSGNFTGAVVPYSEGAGLFNAVSSTATVVVTPPKIVAGAVPEPSTWALMLAGFGLTGYALRRRRAKTAFA